MMISSADPGTGANPAWQALQIFMSTLQGRGISPRRLTDGLAIDWDKLRANPALLTPELYHQLADRFAALLAEAPTPPSLSIAADTFLASADFHMWVVDRAGRIVQAHQPPHDYSAALRGLEAQRLIPPEQRPIFERDLRYVLAEQTAFVSELIIQEKPTRAFEIRLMPMTDGHVLIILADVSERRDYENEVQRYALMLQAVAEVSAHISSMGDFQRLLYTICQVTLEAFTLYHVDIYLLDKNDEYLVIYAQAGAQPPREQAWRLHVPSAGNIAAQAARQ
ncbi:MAG: PAS domain-containing protein, partial [Anaerolineales bacterium]